MQYVASLTVVANTPALTPVSTTLVLPAGTLTGLNIIFPPGCARMTFIQVYDGATLMYPKTAGAAFCEDAFKVAIDCFLVMDAAKTLTIKGWSPGTSYQHVVTVQAEVRTLEELCMARTGYY